MSDAEPNAAPGRLRREPPRFRRVRVRRTESVTPRLVRVTLGGEELTGLTIDEPAASVRLLLPAPGSDALELPTWRGNEFLLPDGRRPTIRTFTPRRVDPDALELDVDAVLHGAGAASQWASSVGTGAPAAVSGPGRGYAVDPGAPAYFLAGDETAIPAIGQLLETIPAMIPIEVHVEVSVSDARAALPAHPRATVVWHDLPDGAAPGDALVAAVTAADIAEGARIWVAGEAAAVQRIRRHLFDERSVPRARTTIRGYWKHGRAGGGDAD